MRSFARCRWTEHQDHLTLHQASQGHQHSHNANKIKQVIKIQGARRALALLNQTVRIQVTRSKALTIPKIEKHPKNHLKNSQNTCLIKRIPGTAIEVIVLQFKLSASLTGEPIALAQSAQMSSVLRLSLKLEST